MSIVPKGQHLATGCGEASGEGVTTKIQDRMAVASANVEVEAMTSYLEDVRSV